MSQVRYPHRATRGLDALEPLNGPLLHDRKRLRPEIARDLIIQSLKPPAEPAKPAPPAPKPIPKETMQARLFLDGEAA